MKNTPNKSQVTNSRSPSSMSKRRFSDSTFSSLSYRTLYQSSVPRTRLKIVPKYYFYDSSTIHLCLILFPMHTGHEQWRRPISYRVNLGGGNLDYRFAYNLRVWGLGFLNFRNSEMGFLYLKVIATGISIKR